MAIRLQQSIPGVRTRPGARSSLARYAAGVQHRRLLASRIVVPRAAAPEAPEAEVEPVETFEVSARLMAAASLAHQANFTHLAENPSNCRSCSTKSHHAYQCF
jgi:hypothetical protein